MCRGEPAPLGPSYLDLERQRDQLWDEVIAARGRIAAAEAEVARLREALEEIAYMCANGYYQPGNVSYAEEAKRIARAALAQKGEK